MDPKEQNGDRKLDQNENCDLNKNENCGLNQNENCDVFLNEEEKSEAIRRHSCEELDSSHQSGRGNGSSNYQYSLPIIKLADDDENDESEELLNPEKSRKSSADLVWTVDEENGDVYKSTQINGGVTHSQSNPLIAKQVSVMEPPERWISPDEFTDLIKREKHKRVRRYYKKQQNLVKSFQTDRELVNKFTEEESEVQREPEVLVSRTEDILAKITLACNVCLLIAKGVAAGLSGSLVVIGSVVDSATDITSGLVIYLTNRAIMKRDMYEYPRGRTRLQPIALVIISVIMGACSVQVISKSLESIARGTLETDVEIPTIVIMVCTVVVKFILMIVCYLYRSSSTAILAQDHRNDTISNAVALICAYLATKFWIYIDPIAAILVSLYILFTWLKTGNEHVKSLSGHAAKPEFINRIVRICLDHQPPFKQLDSVYAYHFGTKYLVEVDVVLDETLSLKKAHDIAEPLQRKIEHLPYVERAFVHIDYETEHRPEYEHKVV